MYEFKFKSNWEICPRDSFPYSLEEAIAIVSMVWMAVNVTRIDGFIRSALRAVDGMEDAMIVVFFRLHVMLVVKMVGKLGMSHMLVCMVVVGGMRIVVRQIVLHFVSHRM